MQQQKVSLIIPVRNERENLETLFLRIHTTLKKSRISYEAVVVDDHSSDGSFELLEKLQNQYPIKLLRKKGRIGKGFSLLEGLRQARSDTLAYIDADLSYPPEALPEMIAKLETHDIVVADRIYIDGERRLKRILGKIFRLIFGRVLFGLNYDVQAGLKVFKKEAIKYLTLHPGTWSFDLEFLFKAIHAGFTITSHPVEFGSRTRGQRKLNLLTAGVELALMALRFRLSPLEPVMIYNGSMKDSKVGWRKRNFTTHTSLHHKHAALRTLTSGQSMILLSLIIFIASITYFNWHTALILLVSLLSSLYFADLLFNVYLIATSFRKDPEVRISKTQVKRFKKPWPTYSIICPLYREWKILPQFIEGIKAIDYPKDKLQVLLVLEEDDRETIQKVKSIPLPDFFKVLIVPHTLPKTKPKACNFALAHATGEYAVIYDAEDIPDSLQLKKAVVAFGKLEGENTVCLQAKLNFYNPKQNLLTRLFTAEYSLWFDLILTGLHGIKAPIPLGGTSNHFKTENIKLLQGWDPFNVTEDCDLGMRLFKFGYRTAVLDSETAEEANSNLKNWLRQRSRWIKGYMQTYLVHMRRPHEFLTDWSNPHLLTFQLVIGGKVLSTLINPFLWLTTILYFALRPVVGEFIESLYLTPIFYIAVISLVFGNFFYLCTYMIGCAKRQQWELVKFALLTPIYWLMMSLSAWIALYQMIVKPHFWEKTHHGLHLTSKPKPKLANIAIRPTVTLRKFTLMTKLKHWTQTLLTGSTLLIGANFIFNTLNYLFVLLMGRWLGLSDFATLAVLSSLLLIVQVAAGALGGTIARYVAYFDRPRGRKHQRWLKQFGKQTSWLFTFLAGAAYLALVVPMKSFFHIDSMVPLLWFAPVFAGVFLLTLYKALLQGRQAFQALAAVLVLEGLAKLGFAVVAVSLGAGLSGALLAYSFSIASAVLLAWIAENKRALRTKSTLRAMEAEKLKSDALRYFRHALASSLGLTVLFAIDVVLIKHLLSSEVAGRYALLTLFGKIIIFGTAAISSVALPIIAKSLPEKKRASQVIHGTFAVVGVYVAVVVSSLVLLPELAASAILGNRAAMIAGLLPRYSIAVGMLALAAFAVRVQIVRKRYWFAYIPLLFAAVLSGFLWFNHESLLSVVSIFQRTMGVFFVITAAAHVALETRWHWGDLKDLFTTRVTARGAEKRKRYILIFNWRDIRHTWAGGAEVYIHELAKRWAKGGHHVTIFCGNDRKSPRNEVIDGVQIVRRGGFYTVYFWAFIYYILRFRGKYDIVIDCENGIPFFTPLYVRVSKYLVIHHVHQDIFRENLKPLLSWLAVFLESKLMPLVYRNCEVITVSKSSKKAITRNGLTRKTPLVIHNGVDLKKFTPGKKARRPLVVYVGRLKPYKNLTVLIQAMKEIVSRLSHVRLVIAGFGEDRERLERLVKKLKLTEHIKFAGKVSEKEKVKLYRQAWVAVSPSSMEGWGVTAIEANACGTPVVASDVPGLRDSVKNPHSGFLVDYQDPNAFANCIFRIITNRRLREDLSENARSWASQFSWEKSATRFMSLFTEQSQPSNIKH